MGVTGVKWQVSKSGLKSAIAYWRDLSGKPCSKQFSCLHMSEVEAFKLAVEYRELMIKELNEQGAGYTPHHGKEKGT